MSEPTPPDRTPSDPTKEAAWDSITDQGLDEALSKAASLASDLVDQLGSPEPEVEAAPPNPLEDPRSDLDAELTELADLTNSASEQLTGVDTPMPSSDSTRADAVPDFMAEFMNPPPAAPETPSPPASEPPLEAVDSDPVHATSEANDDRRVKGVIGGSINIALPAGKRRQEAGAAKADQSKESTHAALGSTRRRLVSTALNPIAASLELADKPFGWVGNKMRAVAGWIAILLLLASVVLFLRRPG